MLYTDLAIDDIPEDSPARRHLDRVIELAYDAKGLSQQILTFGRIEGEAELEAANLAPIVDEALAMVSALLPATINIPCVRLPFTSRILTDTASASPAGMIDSIKILH